MAGRGTPELLREVGGTDIWEDREPCSPVFGLYLCRGSRQALWWWHLSTPKQPLPWPLFRWRPTTDTPDMPM